MIVLWEMFNKKVVKIELVFFGWFYVSIVDYGGIIWAYIIINGLM